MTLDPITACPRRNLNARHWRSDGTCKCPPGTQPLVAPVGLDLPDLPDDRIATLPLPPTLVALMKITMEDMEVVSSFQNFLAQAGPPGSRLYPALYEPRPWPPALYAYAWGLTANCPPPGEM